MAQLTTCLHRPGPARMIAQVLSAELAQGARRARVRTGLSRPRPVDPATWRPPDSAAARAAETTLASHAAPYLVRHSHRSFAFGMAIAAHLGMRPDAELLYIAALFHDLGLTEAFVDDTAFELRGARAAHSLCLDHGMMERRAQRVHEAIALHTSLTAARHAPEVALVHFGAGADVIGYRIEDVATETIERILAAWPRGDFKRSLIADLDWEMDRNRKSPLAPHWRLGFRARIENAPFPS